MSGTATAFSVGLHCCHYVSLPLVHPMQIVVPLPIWLVLERLMKKWMPSPDQLMSGLVGSILGSKLRSKFADPQKPKNPRVGAALSIRRSCFQGVCLQPLQHVSQHFQFFFSMFRVFQWSGSRCCGCQSPWNQAPL